MPNPEIKVTKDGPYIISGGLPLRKEIAEVGTSGAPERWVKGSEYPSRESYALCRCGRSNDKPFCDGTHKQTGFDGTETADHQPFNEQAEKLTGPGIDLLDARKFCSGARFCEPEGGIWNLVPKSGDSSAKESAVREACDCPSGRLVAFDKQTGEPIEPPFPPSISVTEDPQVHMSGPLWVKGGVPVESADGHTYEVRNRMTLCRCGKSANKPFCDGGHFKIQFNDGDPSLT